jgi:aquaporin Z
MLHKLLAEAIGTAIFLGVIIFVVNGPKDVGGLNWLKIGLTLGVMILFLGPVSGGHFNPAVSLMFYLNQQLPLSELGLYWGGQVIGALVALLLYKYFEPDLRTKKE